jgi:hypothetical protein
VGDVGAPGIARIAKEMAGDVAAANPPAAVMVAEIEHVPIATNATNPVVEFTVQMLVVVEVNVIVPLLDPAVVVATNVGLVAAVNA